MPLNLPDKLPAIELLKEENIFVIDNSRATQQDIRPLRIVILNLMPLKITTETDLVRLLSNTPLQVEISFMKIKSHTSKNTPIEHMKTFYTDFDKMRGEKYDGMIITGAPVEQMDFEEVTYWDEITEIFDWARTHVTSTSAGRRRQGSIIIMECRSMHWIRRCSVSLNIVPCNRCIPFSVDLMICSMCRIAATRKCAGKIYRRFRN
jgi:hypothetical protein